MSPGTPRGPDAARREEGRPPEASGACGHPGSAQTCEAAWSGASEAAEVPARVRSEGAPRSRGDKDRCRPKAKGCCHTLSVPAGKAAHGDCEHCPSDVHGSGSAQCTEGLWGHGGPPPRGPVAGSTADSHLQLPRGQLCRGDRAKATRPLGSSRAMVERGVPQATAVLGPRAPCPPTLSVSQTTVPLTPSTPLSSDGCWGASVWAALLTAPGALRLGVLCWHLLLGGPGFMWGEVAVTLPLTSTSRCGSGPSWASWAPVSTPASVCSLEDTKTGSTPGLGALGDEHDQAMSCPHPPSCPD